MPVKKWRILSLREYVNEVIGGKTGSLHYTHTNIPDESRKLYLALDLPNLGYSKTINRRLRSIESLPFIPQAVIMYHGVSLDDEWLLTNCGGRYRHDAMKNRIFLEQSGDAALFKLMHSEQLQ